MTRLSSTFETLKQSNKKALIPYITAGDPEPGVTVQLMHELVAAGADIIELGVPFSDPMADGPVIQQSSDKALKNGMSLKVLFTQLKEIRGDVDIPLLLMGYLNPVLQFGMERFCEHCAVTGIDGIILPDMPMEVFTEKSDILLNNRPDDDFSGSYSATQNKKVVQGMDNLFNRYNLHNIFLVSPQTGTERIKKIDDVSRGFIYMVSSSSTTGIKGEFTPEQITYFERIREMNLKNPRLIGFGISDHESFSTACNYAQGVIIGSAFVKMLSNTLNLENNVQKFVSEIRR